MASMPYNPGTEAALAAGEGQYSGVPFVWANPAARSTDPAQGVTLSLEEISPRTIKAGQGRMDVTLRITNDRATPIDQTSLRIYHRPPAGSAAEIHTSLLANQGEYPANSELLELNEQIEPGETRQIRVAVLAPERTASNTRAAASAEDDITAHVDYTITSPLVEQPGTHPILFSLSGAARSSGGEDENPHAGASSGADSVQLLAVARTTMTVQAGPAEKREDTEPTPATLLWPLAAQTQLTPGATGDSPTRAPLRLLDEDLAKELGEGGRLRRLLDSYITATQDNAELTSATCLAIDPELLDTVDRMAGGYEVGQEPPGKAAEQKRLRDSWGKLFGNDDSDHKPGGGAEDAARWLEDLRAAATDSCTVALPYAGADVNGLAMLNEQADWLAVQALGTGPAIIHRVLGVLPVQDVVVPSAGYVAPEAQRLLVGGSWSSEGRTAGAILDDKAQPTDPALAAELAGDSSMRFEAIQQGAPVLPPQGHVTALVAEDSVTREHAAEPRRAESRAAEAAAASAAAEEDSADTATTAAASTDTAAQAAVSHNNQLVRLDNRTTALTYSSELADSLRATGAYPEVSAFTDPQRRYDLDMDSPVARMGNTLAILEQEINAGTPVLAVPPADWSVSADDASALLNAFAGYLSDGRATAAPLGEVARPDERATTAEGSLALPYEDPGVLSSDFSDEVQSTAEDVNALTLFMRNDPHIALSRETFTHPLTLDALRMFSSYGARSRAIWSSVRTDNVIRAAHVREVADGLRRSVNLVPPGSVFTRTSESSPLIVVARNSLPLPVRAEIAYSAGLEGLTVSVPDSLLIPALGSVTVPLTTQFSGQEARLKMWLATPDNRPISEPVELQVQSVPGMSKKGLAITVLLIVGIGLAGKKLWKRRTVARRKARRASKLLQPEADSS